MVRIEVVMTIEYYEGHEEGWTDDMGIIADKNTWLPAMPSGWYIYNCSPAIKAWALENLKSCVCSNGSYVILDKKEAMLFRIKWS